MLDPFPPPPPGLATTIAPYAQSLGLVTLPTHIHEVVFAALFYQAVESLISPVISARLFPHVYPRLSRRTQINWNVHAVGLVQSLIINILALWVMFTDRERKEMETDVVERVYGYTGACGLIQALATGYFVWDLGCSTRHLGIFGPGILAHAFAALLVFLLGFRPFANYYGPIFVLYEISSPFLNIHWFLDKLNMTGSPTQWYNGIVLIGTFFGCRLVWGTYQSVRVFRDVWAVTHLPTTIPGHLDLAHTMHNFTTATHPVFRARHGQMCLGDGGCVAAQAEVMKFAAPGTPMIPLWMTVVYLGCNVVLNSLNFYWFGKMVETIKKRFDGTPHDEFKRERERDDKAQVPETAAGELEKHTRSGEERHDAVTSGATVTNPDDGVEIGRRRKDLSAQ